MLSDDAAFEGSLAVIEQIIADMAVTRMHACMEYVWNCLCVGAERPSSSLDSF